MQNFEINNLSVQFQPPQINKLPLEFMNGQREEQTGFRKWGMQKMPSKNKELSISWMLDYIINAGLHCFQCIYMAQEEYMHLWKLQFVKNNYLKSSLAPFVLWALCCIYTKLQFQIQTANQSQALLMVRMRRWKKLSPEKPELQQKHHVPGRQQLKIIKVWKNWSITLDPEMMDMYQTRILNQCRLAFLHLPFTLGIIPVCWYKWHRWPSLRGTTDGPRRLSV